MALRMKIIVVKIALKFKASKILDKEGDAQNFWQQIINTWKLSDIELSEYFLSNHEFQQECSYKKIVSFSRISFNKKH